MMQISNLHVNIENKEVLKGINLTIPDNEVHTLFGPNGSGKSVLISTIMGYPEYEITQGKILFNGQNIIELSIDERVKLGIGISEQRPPVVKGVKLRNLLELLVSVKLNDDSFMKEMVSKYDIEKFLERNINDGLSGGEVKKSELFMALITRPEFLILDEPDSGVDPEHLKKIGAMINEILRKETDKLDTCNPLVRNSGLIATHSAVILDYIHTDKAHIMMDGKIRCSGNPGIMMEQIRAKGYDYCIRCQQIKQEISL
ncbi:MAG: ABC transporter ATP-binding protein [Marinilabiliaceae bacterium]|nr:ABC transporter ATP-binding protein [Marinilabiliaceae bacterium]